MGIREHAVVDSLSDAELEGLHEVEQAIEHLRRAHGHLIAFHHSIGRGMNHMAAAEPHLREAGYGDLADEIRDEHLPRGVIEGRRPGGHGRWTYDVLETYEEVFLEDVAAFGEEVTETVADGLRHAHERRQEREWKRRARRD